MKSEVTRDSLRKELARLYEDLQTSYPPANGDEEIAHLHDALVLYDLDVAGAITEILDGPGRFFRLRHYEGLHENKGLERRIRKLQAKGPSNARVAEALRQYAEYYALIRKAIHTARLLLKIRD